ncbi:GATA type zinc finger protein asd-4 [Sordaria brevicollis]|uniref:GATA type zinc finger protein asd-4 n=1 Tax=Sordaria brevicollis TaxID=83679 RepID=A0AAE0PF50_SORBR|nr:GATA type zinc finger protein asd-4 [Sordaria brevicollis]
MATMANHDRETTQPTCQNCATSTTPLWRRDEMGQVLCNACGLFLKLHGRPRPISLKTDVIKSRNRVKTMRPDLAKQKKQQQQQQQQQNLAATADMNGGVGMMDPNNPAAAAAAQAARRASQKSMNGHPVDDNSPVSRTGTPNVYHPHIPIDHNLEYQFQAQQIPGFGVPTASPGRAPSPMNGEHMPQTHEQLLAANASLKTRVSELEVIQELYRGRLHQLETEENIRQASEPGKLEAQLRGQIDAMAEAHQQLQKELEESHRRENMLKRRLDELEVELKDVKEALESQDNGRHKKIRLDDNTKSEPTADVIDQQLQQEQQQHQHQQQPEPVEQPAPTPMVIDEPAPAPAPVPEAAPEQAPEPAPEPVHDQIQEPEAAAAPVSEPTEAPAPAPAPEAEPGPEPTPAAPETASAEEQPTEQPAAPEVVPTELPAAPAAVEEALKAESES